MNGISGYVSIMCDDLNYLQLSRINKLKHDLHCLKVAGMTGPILPMISEEYRERQEYISNVEKLIKQEERKLKIQKINE